MRSAAIGDAIPDLAADDVEGGREEQAETRHSNHPEEHRRTQRLAELGTGARRQQQRHAPEDEGEAGHEDRAKTVVRCANGGFEG